jgi:hypothetical protein
VIQKLEGRQPPDIQQKVEMLCDVEFFSIRIPRPKRSSLQGNDNIVMGLARILVDLYGVSAAVKNVTTNLAKVEVEYATHHLRTSSLVNARQATVQKQPVTPLSEDTTLQSQQTPHETTKEFEPIKAQVKEPRTEINSDSIISPSQQPAATNRSNTAKLETNGSVSPPIETYARESQVTTETKNPVPESNVESQLTANNKMRTSVGAEQLFPSQADILLASSIDTPEPEVETARRVLKSSRIPTSRTSRLWHYGSLATAMGFGAMNESLKRMTGVSKSEGGKHT